MKEITHTSTKQTTKHWNYPGWHWEVPFSCSIPQGPFVHPCLNQRGEALADLFLSRVGQPRYFLSGVWKTKTKLLETPTWNEEMVHSFFSDWSHRGTVSGEATPFHQSICHPSLIQEGQLQEYLESQQCPALLKTFPWCKYLMYVCHIIPAAKHPASPKAQCPTTVAVDSTPLLSDTHCRRSGNASSPFHGLEFS